MWKKLVQPLWRTVWKIPLKTKNRATLWSSNPTPRHISGKDENSNSKRYIHPNVHNSSIYNSQDMRPKCPPTDEWIKKMWYIYIYHGILLNHKKWSIAICSNMDGLREYHTKWSKSDRERQTLHDVTYMWNLKNSTNESIYKTKTDSQT